jgi:Pro-kumamolisin, activation domain
MNRMFLGVAVAALCTLSTGGLATAGGVGLVKLKGNHPVELASLGPVAPADQAMELHLAVELGIHDRTKLDQLLADQQNPSSSQYHRWLTPEKFNRRFGPTRAQTDAAVRWLKSQGLQVNSINRLGRTISVTAEVSQGGALLPPASSRAALASAILPTRRFRRI